MDTNYSKIFFEYVGGVEIITDIEIEELGKIISHELFGNIPFEGLLDYVYDEVPTILIKRNLMGLDVKLFGYNSSFETGKYFLQILPRHNITNIDLKRVNFSFTLFLLLEFSLSKYKNIRVQYDSSEFGE